MIIPFRAAEATLQSAGGKGANLLRLVKAGFPVPAGVIVTTEAYRQFVAANQLAGSIRETTAGLSAEDPAELTVAADAIRSEFTNGRLPPEVHSAIRTAYAELGRVPVAVRSSATLEDLPDLSFAGQQDTYLNVRGEEQLLAAVVGCWASLWTARAMAYRIRNELAYERFELAVVIQEMVTSEVSGVLFTANPVTGMRRETVIDATFGLGEALVSGEVEPDHFVIDHLAGTVERAELGAKALATRLKPDGGVETVRAKEGGRRSLREAQILRLAEVGQRVQEVLDGPQDIEWAFVGEQLYLLQARPITSLYPVPEVSFDPLIAWFAFGTVQGLMGPMTPLGREAVRSVLAGAGALFWLRLEPGEFDLLSTAGERLWININKLIRNPLGNRVLRPAVSYVEPSVSRIIDRLTQEPELGAGEGRLRIGSLLRLAVFFLPALLRSLINFARPAAARAALDKAIEAHLNAATIEPGRDRFGELKNVVGFMRSQLAGAFPRLLPRFVPTFAPSMASLTLLGRLTNGDRSAVLEVTRGMPANVTTEMDLALWAVAEDIRGERESRQLFHAEAAEALAAGYRAGDLPVIAQHSIADFMELYGMRGVGEIDIGRPRWRDEPAPLMQTLKSYLQVGPEGAPDVRYQQGAQAAQSAVERLAAKAREGSFGPLRETLVRAAARRVRILMGARESPKFFVIRLMGKVREGLLAVGERFVAAGTIDRADDLFFLHAAELESLAAGDSCNWRALISARRAEYRREGRRRQVPRVLVSDGRAFFEGLGADVDAGDLISGSPVSPGQVEGIVRVVFDPSEARLAPGEILVCPGTDPAWTPLFMTAGGLITEVGGMMTHGSVVAREYGIPAVVGVHQATDRLTDGQKILLDGTRGRIVLVD